MVMLMIWLYIRYSYRITLQFMEEDSTSQNQIQNYAYNIVKASITPPNYQED